MNERQAREVLLLQAFETMPGESPQWTAEDRRWATRAVAQSLGEGASREAFVAERARLAMQRLAPRDVGVKRLLGGSPLAGAAAAGLALAVGALAGLASDTLVAGDHVNLLSPLFWGLLAWNLGLYLWLGLAALRGAEAGPGRRALAGLWQRGAARAGRRGPVAGFAARWAVAAAPLNAARAAVALHLLAAGVAIGLVGGLLLRGLVFDYRAGWATTLLDPATVHAAVTTALAPAFALTSALTGQGAPDVAAFEALRVVPGRPATASAAPWMVWMSVQLALLVIVPRLLLAGWAGWHARRRADDFALALSGPYFDRLRPPEAGQGVWVLPHAQAPDPQTVLGLRRLLASVWGDAVPLEVAPPLPYGDEEDPPASPAGARPLVLVDLATTPEPDVHRRLLDALAGRGAAPLLVADTAGFVRRFGAGDRLQARAAAWRTLAQDAGAGFVAADLAAGDTTASEAALRDALGATA